MNKAILHGYLARDVELRSTSTGKQQADFIPLIAWGKTAEIFGKYLSKGSELLAEGRIQVRSYDDKNGNKKYITEIVVDSFDFCGSKSGNAGALVTGMEDVQPLPEGAGSFGTVASADEEIPF